MSRAHRTFLLALLLTAAAAPASAQEFGRGWFEKWSGPGPFEGLEIGLPIGCRWDTAGPQKFYWYFQTPFAMTRAASDHARSGLADPTSARTLCVNFSYTSATNKDSADVGLIALRLIEGRVDFPLERQKFPWWLAAFEPSVALGMMRLQGPDFGEWRLALSPEITLKPLKFIPAGAARVSNANKRGDWRGLIEIAYGTVFITPGVKNDDLRVPQLAAFDHGWLQRSTWVRVDVSEVFGVR